MRILFPILCLSLASALSAAVLRTTEGGALELSDDGQVVGLAFGAAKLPVIAGEGGGFYVVDRQAQHEGSPPATAYLRAPMLPDGGMQIQQQRFAELGVTLEVSYAGAGEYVSFSGKLTDHTGQDRALEVGYEIPLQAHGWMWWDDLAQRRRADQLIAYRSTYPCAAGPGYCQTYPFSSLARGSVGLTLGAPPAQGPRVYVIEYDNARRRLAIRFHLGLSPRVKKLPGQAWFSFMLYSHEGAFGMRSAAERYYHFFPEDFAKRAPHEGHLGYDHQESGDGVSGPRAWYGVPALGDFGQAFPWIAHAETTRPVAEAQQSLEAAIKAWQVREPRREPFTWVVSADATGAVGTKLDAREASLSASTTPLTYEHGSGKPAVADPVWELNAQVLGPLARRHEFLLLRRLVSDAPEAGAGWPFFDIGMIACGAEEAARANLDLYARTAAYRRIVRYGAPGPVGRLIAGPSARPLPEAAVRAMLQRGLVYAIYPHLWPEALPYRDLYAQVVPVIARLSRAGWEPVTLALCEDKEVRLERYGRLQDTSLCFAVRNDGKATKTARVIFDPALGLPKTPAGVEAWELLSGRRLAPVLERGRVAVPVRLRAGAAAAVSVLPRGPHLQRTLLEAAGTVEEAVPLAAEEVSVQPSRPGNLMVGDGPAATTAGGVLCDGWTTNQGLVWEAGEALTVNLDLNSLHRLQGLRVWYGLGEGHEAPAATLEGRDREGEWCKLGTLAVGSSGEAAPILDITDEGEYQLLRLVYPALGKRLWIKEIAVRGRDAALMRAAQRFRTLAAEEDFDDFGVVSQLAIALRVRRMLGHDKALQEQALTHLSDFCSVAGGVEVAVELPEEAPAVGSVEAQLVLMNRGTEAWREGAVKLKLPPGWSAAPGKVELTLAAGQTARRPLTLVRAAGGGRLTLLTTGLVGGRSLFMSAQR
jgi:hypothetical protein